MRVRVLVKATEESEKGFKFTPETKAMMEAMGKFNDELKRRQRNTPGTLETPRAL